MTGVTGSVADARDPAAGQPRLTILNRFGGTSLIPASERGHVDYVAGSSRPSIDVDHVNDLGWTALLEAVILGDGSPVTSGSCASCSTPGPTRPWPTRGASRHSTRSATRPGRGRQDLA